MLIFFSGIGRARTSQRCYCACTTATHATRCIELKRRRFFLLITKPHLPGAHRATKPNILYILYHFPTSTPQSSNPIPTSMLYPLLYRPPQYKFLSLLTGSLFRPSSARHAYSRGTIEAALLFLSPTNASWHGMRPPNSINRISGMLDNKRKSNCCQVCPRHSSPSSLSRTNSPSTFSRGLKERTPLPTNPSQCYGGHIDHPSSLTPVSPHLNISWTDSLLYPPFPSIVPQSCPWSLSSFSFPLWGFFPSNSPSSRSSFRDLGPFLFIL